MKFVIIGGDAAGMSAASRAKRNDPAMDVVVFEKTGDVSYSACGMPYNIADANREIEELVVRRAEVFREKQGIDLRIGHRVDRIDCAAKTVEGMTLAGRNFESSYDRLLLATGARAVTPDLPGIDLPGVFCLKSLEDGRRIKQFIANRPVKEAVIVGMGFIALEMAEALKARGLDVAMVKPHPVFVPWLHPKLATVVKQEMESNGVQLHIGHTIKEIRESRSGLRVLCEDLELEGQMVLIAIGVGPRSELAADAGLALGPNQSIAVDRTMRTSDENIYAAGDCADAYHVVTGGKTWIPLALRANRSGWAVADTVTGNRVELEGVAGTAVFKVFDLQVARTGLTATEAGRFGFIPAEVTVKGRSRAHAHPGAEDIWVQMVGDKKSGKLLGAQMVGKEGAAHRINAAAVALHAGMTVQAFGQTDLAYAPPFGPTWDPLLTAANQLLKAI